MQVVTGGVDETTELLAQRFDHIFYTGNGTVGRVVMRAAAAPPHAGDARARWQEPDDRRPVRPISPSAPAAIAWGKFVNAGQTCVAPDYVLVDEAVHDRFVAELATFDHVRSTAPTRRRRPTTGGSSTPRHLARLVGLLDGGGYEHTAVGGEYDDRQPLHGTDRAHRRQARRGGDGGRDLRSDPAGDRRTGRSARRSVSSTSARSRWRCTCSPTIGVPSSR